MTHLPITRVVLYKHGIGYFEREGVVEGDTTLTLTFKQAEVSDVLKSLTVLDLAGGHVSSVSYDSTKPLAQLLAEVALSIPDQGSLVGLLPQIKGARVAVHTNQRVEGVLLGVDTADRQSADGIARVVLISLLTEGGEVRSFELHALAKLEILDPALRRDLDYYLRTQLSAKKKDARTFTFFAQGQGKRTIRISYTLEAPVWKATYRVILGAEKQPPMIQGWAVVDNTQDEDWENVQLSLVAGLPVSFVHDLYTPRYIRRPVVAVEETTGVLPPEVESGMALTAEMEEAEAAIAQAPPVPALGRLDARVSAPSSTPARVRERNVGDLFEYEIEHPVTIRRNQSALVPIVLRAFGGRPVLLHNRETRRENPMRCVEFENSTGLTLESGPVTVLEGGSYVGEAMLDTLKPVERRLVPYAVELGIHVLDSVDSHDDRAHRIVLRRGSMKAYYTQVEQTTYHFDNQTDTVQTAYLDHRRRGDEWELVETQQPEETTEHFWRFRFPVPAKQITRFVVRQQHTLHRVHTLADATDAQLEFWVDQRYFDEDTAQVVRQIAALRQRATGFDEHIDRLEKERATYHAEQKRVRENLEALGDRASEKILRERFVRSLHVQEDRLEQLENEIRAQISARDVCREEMNKLLGELEYETANQSGSHDNAKV